MCKMNEIKNDLYGWFDLTIPFVGRPIHDPGMFAPCPYCGISIETNNMRTHYFFFLNTDRRKYFFRTHMNCDELATPGEKRSLISAICSRIKKEQTA